MSTAVLRKGRGGIQDAQNRMALNDEQNFDRLLETALPLVRPFVRRMKRWLPRNLPACLGAGSSLRNCDRLYHGKTTDPTADPL